MKVLFVMLMAVCMIAAPARAEVRIAVAYGEAADVFSLMDNVSRWREGFTDPAYRDEWVTRFGWSAADQAITDRYTAYRLRIYVDEAQGLDPATSRDGLFNPATANTAASDPLAVHFLLQPSARAALQTLARSASADDARMLRQFYAHFAPKWRLLLADRQAHMAGATELERYFNTSQVSAFIDRMARFYGVTVSGTFQVFLTRYPPGRQSSAEVLAGNYILLHAPAGAPITATDWDGIVMHELAHYMSARQPAEQKQALTREFLAICPMPPGVRRFWLIEEPLAVAWGQAAYSIQVHGRPLDPLDNWYSVPWIDIVSRAIAPTVIAGYGTGATINDGIVREAADRCVSLTSIAATMSAQQSN